MPPPRPLRISVVVPTLHEEQAIADTLRALLAAAASSPGTLAEIIVADGGSRDGTRREVERLAAGHAGLRWLDAPRGRGAQQRAGAEAATGDAIWFVHADTRVPPDSLAAIQQALAAPHASGGNFGLTFDGPTWAARHLTDVYPLLRWLGLSYGDAGIFCRRAAYQAVGGMRPLPLFEDLDLVRRLRRQGRFVHLDTRIVTSSRRFEQGGYLRTWARWILLQVLYWCGVPPRWLALLYPPQRPRPSASASTRGR